MILNTDFFKKAMNVTKYILPHNDTQIIKCDRYTM